MEIHYKNYSSIQSKDKKFKVKMFLPNAKQIKILINELSWKEDISELTKMDEVEVDKEWL